jgi:putative intracellular protease/amidase
MHPFPKALAGFALLATVAAGFAPACASEVAVERIQAPDSRGEKIDPYQARFGRARPVVAVVGENGSPDSSTELTDFMIPYGVLTQSGVADTVALSTQPGLLKMRQALTIKPQQTVAEFDVRFPEGADYVIVPAVSKFQDATLLNWIRAQGAKGATIVSICDGALVVASSGLMKGHRATAHWDTQELRFKKFPDIDWQKNVRYVADGKIVSSAGISAAMPISIALVEAIAGHARAAALAAELGVGEWSARHDSDVFIPQFGVNLGAFATTHFANPWFHSMQSIGVPLAAGVDDIALAFTADAYSRTGRSQAYSLSATAQPVLTRHGLMIVPDRIADVGDALNQVLPAFDATPPALALDTAIAGIERRYGRRTAYGVALDFEYPGFHY